MKKAKTKSWKDLLQDAMSNSDGPNMWNVIQGLNGTPDANSPNKDSQLHDRQSHDSHMTVAISLTSNLKPTSS